MFRTWGAKQHGGEPESWAVLQDHRGIILAANRNGVLEFDGARWRHIRIGDGLPVFALANGPEQKIYLGTRGDFGYMVPNPQGFLEFTSLLDRLDPESRNFAQMWSIWGTPSGMVFGSDTRQLRLHGGEFQSFSVPKGFLFSSLLGSRLIVRDQALALWELNNEGLVKLAEYEPSLREGPRAAFADPADPAGSAWITFASQLQGSGLQAWPIPASVFEQVPQCALRLPDGRMLIGTQKGGLFVLDHDGKELASWNSDDGLPRGRIIGLARDREAGLWLATGSGLARLQLESPISHFGETRGLNGAIYSIQRLRGQLYVGTSLGLYRLVPGARAKFELIDDVGSQVFDIVQFESRLLVGHYQGVTEIYPDGRTHRFAEGMVLAIEASAIHPGRLFVASQSGLDVFQYQGQDWQRLGQVAGVDVKLQNLFEDEDGSLWANAVGGGVLRLNWSAGQDALLPEVYRFGRADGLPIDQQNQPFSFNHRPIFGTKRGIYRFDSDTARFHPDSALSDLFAGQSPEVSNILAAPDGRLWMTVNFEGLGYVGGVAEPSPDGVYRWNTALLKGAEGVGSETPNSILLDDDGVVWLGGAEGLYRFDPTAPTPPAPDYTALLRRVVAADGKDLPWASDVSVPLAYAHNRLRFEFAAPSFEGGPSQYQVWLEGNDTEWSDWSPEDYRDFSNLWEGAYRFHVRAKNWRGQVSQEAVFSFSVLPPWYRTWWAYGFYLLVLAASTGLVSRWRVRHLQRQREALQHEVDARTRELKLANLALEQASLTDQLTGLRNRRFLDQLLESEVSRVVRRQRDARPNANQVESSELVFFLIDLDHFKSVNDRYGHHAGDLVLVQFTRVLREVFRESDHLVRWGGEEFLVVAHSCGRDGASELAERVRRKVEATDFDIGNGQFLRKTCSIGFACFPFVSQAPEALTWQQVVELADRCLYAAKQSQRNAWVGIVSGQNVSTADFFERWNSQPQDLVASGEVTVHTSLSAGTHIQW
ncbi:ligand-binding sensor domain-containing diguanylate cyclase [Pseudomarimonas arenosa]|uniref:diguanylate cyclase n=1 Tax=Pseudomarimonas arenosa TaxID=2774145 RepID=A0AAW3ZMT2_9GAMM|nr:ligand-binding sensor domain-containing diguanylate cyclase [Pseudomarimonas arenosa]MBD8526382.1 diguanylate cyclase [Pseudomarimonas arenosa]